LAEPLRAPDRLGKLAVALLELLAKLIRRDPTRKTIHLICSHAANRVRPVQKLSEDKYEELLGFAGGAC
jgi:hypothetical protein